MSIKSLFKSSSLDDYIDTNSVKLDVIAQQLFNKAKNDELSHMLSLAHLTSYSYLAFC